MPARSATCPLLQGPHSRSDTLIGIEDLGGSGFADTLVGDAGPNRLYGLGRSDMLSGLQGDDLLDGGSGLDTGDGGPHGVADTCISIETPTDCETLT